MSGFDEKKNRKEQTDSFWDIEALIPRRTVSFSKPRDCETREISSSSASVPRTASSDGTVFTRYIPPHSAEGNLSVAREEWESEESYVPEDSLLHRVVLKKKKSA